MGGDLRISDKFKNVMNRRSRRTGNHLVVVIYFPLRLVLNQQILNGRIISRL